ncbi:lysophosphatidic acid receptor 6-like [Hyperolius riggenbachi]|uniref:lysophosphatidic acid receptor 6-like n=1 Tax=Hyperolius riggenbachi TaxID=752182 RepID=UPI0035A2663B
MSAMLNSSGNFTGCQPQPINPFIPIFLSFIFFIGFVLNCISLWIFWFKVKQWNAMVVLQFNLAITDAMVTPAAPLVVIYGLMDRWTFGVFLCQFKAFALSIHAYGSMYFLALISIFRYLSIARNDKRKVLTTKPFIKKLCLIMWGVMMCQAVPSFFVVETSEVRGVTKCLSIQQTDQTDFFYALLWFTQFFGLLIPFFITLASYSLLIKYLRRVKPMNSLSKVMLSKSVMTIFVTLIIFIICYIPSYVTRFAVIVITSFHRDNCSLLENVENVFNITLTIVATNSLMDPILYCFASDKFRATFTSCCTFYCPFLQRQQHQENMEVSDCGGQTEEPKNIHQTVLLTMDSSERRPVAAVEWEN